MPNPDKFSPEVEEALMNLLVEREKNPIASGGRRFSDKRSDGKLSIWGIKGRLRDLFPGQPIPTLSTIHGRLRKLRSKEDKHQ